MKKTIVIILSFLPLFLSAQTREKPYTPSLKEGDIFVNPAYFGGLADELNQSTLPPLGVVVDYAMGPNYLVGVEVAQAKDASDNVRLIALRMGSALGIKPKFHLYSIASIGLKQSNISGLKSKKSTYGAYFGLRAMPIENIPIGIFAELGYSEVVFYKAGVSVKL